MFPFIRLNLQILSPKMAFIVPVVRRDFPLYTQRQPPHTLAIQKRRCESLPINFHDVNLPTGSSPSLEEQRRIRLPHSPSKPSKNIPSSAEQQTPKKSARDWFFPNRRISITRLDNGEMESPRINEKKGRRRVHFGICERVEYGEKEEDGENKNEEERENVDPKCPGKCGDEKEEGAQKLECEPNEGGGIDANAAIPPIIRSSKKISSKNNGSKERGTCPSIMALAEQKDQNGEEMAVDLMGEKGKYNAVIFRLMSSLCTSKM